MKLDINQTLIYCLRPTNKSEPYKLKCSQYHSAMVDNTNIDLFQDRTPRPIINFDNMKDDRVSLYSLDSSLFLTLCNIYLKYSFLIQ